MCQILSKFNEKVSFILCRLVQTNTELETMLNMQYMFLETNKQKDFTKFLPTILYNVVKEDIFSEPFLVSWHKGEIKDIEKNFLFNLQRDSDFKKAVLPYLQSLQ